MLFIMLFQIWVFVHQQRGDAVNRIFVVNKVMRRNAVNRSIEQNRFLHRMRIAHFFQDQADFCENEIVGHFLLFRKPFQQVMLHTDAVQQSPVVPLFFQNTEDIFYQSPNRFIRIFGKSKRGSNVFQPSVEDSFQEIFFALEVIIHQPQGYFSFPGNLPDGCFFVSVLAEQPRSEERRVGKEAHTLIYGINERLFKKLNKIFKKQEA
mgnify:CR=1 FL=1